ncbi:MAG: hypothetical protein ACYCXA_05320 [Actinomycetes bacterium]
MSLPAPMVAGPDTTWFDPAWRPFAACDNGLPASAWAPLLDVRGDATPMLLRVLGEAGIPACTAPARPCQGGRRAATVMRLWVDVAHRPAAEDVLRRCAGPELTC